jgi:hypothetical protein
MIPKPKGSVGEAGFSLITEMKLDKYNPKDKALYNDILVGREVILNHHSNSQMVQASVRALAIGAGIELGRSYKDQSITRLAKLMLAVSIYLTN